MNDIERLWQAKRQKYEESDLTIELDMMLYEEAANEIAFADYTKGMVV